MPSDFTTELAVFQDGQEIARKTIRVNDPLAVGGYTFHQNGFGPAPHLVIRDTAGKPLWDAQVPMTDSARGSPYVTMAVPGRDFGLQLLLTRDDAGPGRRPRAAVSHPRRERRTGPRSSRTSSAVTLLRGDTRVSDELGISLELTDFGEYTLLIAKRDPGQPHRVAGLRVADHRHRDHVLPATTPGLGAHRARWPGRRWSGAPTDTSTWSGSSGGCSTTSWRRDGRHRTAGPRADCLTAAQRVA